MYRVEDGVLTGVTNKDLQNGTFIFPEGVTSIGVGAFSGCSNLIEVILPETVTSIEEGAFAGCSNLTEITLPETVTNIGPFAFHRCIGLKEIIIPESVTLIGKYAFYRCIGLKEIIIPESVTYIGKFAFYCCTGLKEITLPENFINYEGGIFCICDNLTKIKISTTDPAKEKVNQALKRIPRSSRIIVEIDEQCHIKPAKKDEKNCASKSASSEFFSQTSCDSGKEQHKEKPASCCSIL